MQVSLGGFLITCSFDIVYCGGFFLYIFVLNPHTDLCASS